VAGRHLFVCVNDRASGKPACGPRGGDALVAAVQRELLARGALDALVTPCGCLGPCFDGPNAVIYPEGTWYAGLAPGDAAALADHLATGRRLAAKISERPGAEDPAPPAADAPPEHAGDGDGDGGDGAGKIGHAGNDAPPEHAGDGDGGDGAGKIGHAGNDLPREPE
jgi:(2Fe-2S) ferredoxin